MTSIVYCLQRPVRLNILNYVYMIFLKLHRTCVINNFGDIKSIIELVIEFTLRSTMVNTKHFTDQCHFIQ